MSYDFPCLLIDLSMIKHNVRTILEKCRDLGVEPVGVNKLTCNAMEIAQIFVDAGLQTIADSRLKNLKKIAHLPVEKMLLRLPQITQAYDIVKYADISLNSEAHTLRALSVAAVAQNKIHKVILMHDLGDLREGCIDPEETKNLAKLVCELPGLTLEGIGSNLACYGGVEPSTENQTYLVNLAGEIERELNCKLNTVSGASSMGLLLLLRGGMPKGINQLRLGASFIMGIGINDEPVPDTHQDTMKLGVEIIELKDKPSVPVNSTSLDAMGEKPTFEDIGVHRRALCAVGKQDVAVMNLIPIDPAVKIIGGSSDHLIIDVTHSQADYQVGDIVYFALNYSTALECMTSEYISKYYC